jgi:hypothetical protein
MRILALSILSLALLAAADPPQRQLDPRQAADAVVIVDQLTRQLSLPREQAVALTLAIQTLDAAVREQAEAKAKAADAKPPAAAKKD